MVGNNQARTVRGVQYPAVGKRPGGCAGIADSAPGGPQTGDAPGVVYGAGTQIGQRIVAGLPRVGSAATGWRGERCRRLRIEINGLVLPLDAPIGI